MPDRLLALLQDAWRGDQQALASAYAESVRVHGILGKMAFPRQVTDPDPAIPV